MEDYIDESTLNKIIESIKIDYLSKPNLPKLIIGSGSSITFDYPSMDDLANELNKELRNDETFKKIYPEIKEKGLERGLSSLKKEDIILKDIRKNIAGTILRHEIKNEQKNLYFKLRA
ncbi:hypothetical protein [Listeria aquatica]|uniref:Uncharacterized protein n=1 Tax=Listeria aquatica FSL S10-1188 TaxID=1265818 RepID=W7BC52_9LIST|nr:hypothetical protein [Listeria aquatica]EUJ20556.1 hypothetical protein MAQA_03966 [Listeria aquatica FSL S10-1188]